MNVQNHVIEAITVLLQEDELPIPSFDDDIVLLDSGLDSLGFAVLVTRLEESLGYDPFTLMTEAVYPRTLGEFVAIYEKHAPH